MLRWLQVRANYCVPIKGYDHDRVIGAIELLNKHDGTFDENDQSMLV